MHLESPMGERSNALGIALRCLIPVSTSSLPVAGFHWRDATATLGDAPATGASISDIFQPAEDFAVLGQYNARAALRADQRPSS